MVAVDLVVYFSFIEIPDVARSGSLNLFGSISKLTKILHLLVRGRCYLNNLSLKIALPARVNKVLREFAGKDLVDCYEVV